jgi:hypothetical protein
MSSISYLLLAFLADDKFRLRLIVEQAAVGEIDAVD